MKFRFPRIYPITDTRISGLSHAEQVRRLVDGGATMIQLRDKAASPRKFYDAAREAISIARAHNTKVIINDRVDIAHALQADGVHLGQDDLPPEHARLILGADAIIGFSTHSLEQAIAALSSPIDYIAIGPIFETSTKSDHEPIVGLERLAKVRNATGNIPLVAIGGIRRADITAIFDAGVDSVALISEIFSHPDDIARTMTELGNL